jgi:Uma2 family endonuclease
MDMLTPTIDTFDIQATVRVSGKVIARGVDYEAFMDTEYGEKHVEWVNGVVIEMAGIDERHDALNGFLRILLTVLLEKTSGGRIFQDPMLMKLPTVPSSRAPDIQILLPDRAGQLIKNQVIGPASLVIEIVSQGSRRIDLVDKRREYELGGVPEYWVIDHETRKALFLQLNEAGIYDEIAPDTQGIYCSNILHRFCFPVELLWRETLPTVAEIVQLVEDMLK